MEEHDILSRASILDVLADDAAVGPLVRLAALAHALDAPGAPEPSRAELRDGLAALGAAEPTLERVALVVTAHARAAGFTWSEIAEVQGGRADACRQAAQWMDRDTRTLSHRSLQGPCRWSWSCAGRPGRPGQRQSR